MQALCTIWTIKAAVRSVLLQRVLSSSCCTVREGTWLLWWQKDWSSHSTEWHMMALHQKLLRSELKINFHIIQRLNPQRRKILYQTQLFNFYPLFSFYIMSHILNYNYNYASWFSWGMIPFLRAWNSVLKTGLWELLKTGSCENYCQSCNCPCCFWYVATWCWELELFFCHHSHQKLIFFNQVKLSGQSGKSQIIWAGRQVLATASEENVVR